jgi:hypothetical protein
MDYINVHIAGTDTDTDTDTLMMANEAWAKNFVVWDFIHLVFHEKQPNVFYMNIKCLCNYLKKQNSFNKEISLRCDSEML